jgi:ribulose-5-phosphate 4-epimerase/fuculose-1-phosphate aldolase
VSELEECLRDLVVANRILANEGVLDAYGHVSIRHPERPDRFFLSCSRAPELVVHDDLMEYDLDCNPIDQQGRMMVAERPIHGAVYAARPDAVAVVHNHAHELIPFSVTDVKLRPLFHMAASLGADVPVWDIRDRFGDTDMLVRTMEQGHDLARALGPRRVALMRGHGSVVAAASMREAVVTAVYLMVNARMQDRAMAYGPIKFLSDGEIDKMFQAIMAPTSINRVWEYWARRCGALDL